AELKPDVIVFDLHMAGNNFSTPFLSCYKLLAISFANDDEAQELADSIGAVKLLDKAELANELIPRFWNWHQRAYRVSDHNFSANVTSQPSNLSDRKSIVSARANGIRKS